MEINEYYKSPELFRMVKEHFKEEQKPSYSFDITPNMRHITARNQDGSITKDISYGDLNPSNVYALRMTTTNVDTGTQETSFALFLDRKMAEVHFTQNKTLNDLTINREVLTGVMVEGNFDGNLLKQLNVGIEDFNRAAIFSTTQDRYASGQFPQIEKNASTIAERLFNDIQLKNEYVSNMVGRGSTSDLNRYYELSRDQNSSVRHIDAFLVEEHKESLAKAQVQQAANNEEYQYVGMIHSKDHSTPSVAYTNANEYLKAIEEGLKTNPQNLGYETISQDPQLHKDVDDIIYRHFGINNPHPFEYYTIEGQKPIKLDESNNPQITIMDLAKELGFTYRNTNGQGDIIMQKIVQPNENKPQITQIDLTIENAENPLKNTVTVDYSSFNDSKSMVQGPNFNPIAQDSDFHLSFNEFVALTKPLNSEEIVKRMENQTTNAETLPLDIDFLKQTFLDLKQQESHKQDTSVNGQLYNKVLDTLFELWGNEPEKSIPIAKDLVEYAKQHTDNEFAKQIVENYEKVNGIKPENMETKQTVDNSRSHTTIVDLAKELGFSYEGKDSLLGDVVMRYKYDYDNKENGQKETAHVALSIKNPDDPQKNTVNVITTFFDANNKTIGTYYDNNQTFDQFVNLTKTLGSKEAKERLQNNKELNIHNTIPSENRIVIDHYHNTELFPLIDKQFNKISPAPLIDAYEIGLINESKLSVLPLYDKGQIELTPGEPKQIDIKDLAPTKIHAYFEYTTNVSTLEQLPKYKLSLDENNERLHNSREQLPQETVKHGVAIHGDFDNHFVNLTANGDQNQAVLIALASTMANDPYFKITEQTPFFVLDAISKGREQAEGLFHDLTLTNEYSTNIEPKGTNKDLLQYYKLTNGEEPQLFHINSTEVDDYKNKVQREIHMGQEHPEDKYTKLNYTPLLDQSFIEKTFSALIIKNADDEKNTVNRQIFDLTNDLVQPIIKTDPLNSKIAAQALINYAKEHPENEYARQIIENHELQKSKTQPLEKTNIEVDLKKDFQYETASIRPQTHLINDLMDKYKLNSSTILKFAPFIEAAHPVNKPHTDNSQDTVVFPYVKTNSSYNLDGHIASTMSADPSIINKSKTNTTNAPIGYEHYTEGQKIPITHHTNTAAIEGGTWMATTAKNPEDVKTVHIYNSAIDAMSSYELHKIKPELENTAFISVGTMAHNSQIRGIKELFPNATMYLNFQNNIMGELSTIKSVAVLADNPVNIKTDGRNIDFKLSDGLEFKLNAGMTNYKNFEKMSGINHLDIPNLIVLPPAKGITWNDTLKQQNTQRQDEKQEHHRGMKL